MNDMFQIGLMRSGRFLAEESPHVLLSMYQCLSLEEVFLKLSRKQGQIPTQNDRNISNNISLASLTWGKKDSISVSEESGVVGLNFHQSKEILIADGTNGHIEVSKVLQIITACSFYNNLSSQDAIKVNLCCFLRTR